MTKTATKQTIKSANQQNDIALADLSLTDLNVDVGTNQRLEQQRILDEIAIPNQYEVWANGVYERLIFKVPEGEEPAPYPSLDREAPTAHATPTRLKKICDRPVYVSGIGHRMDDKKDLIGITYLRAFHKDE